MPPDRRSPATRLAYCPSCGDLERIPGASSGTGADGSDECVGRDARDVRDARDGCDARDEPDPCDRCDVCGSGGRVRVNAPGTVYTFTVVHVGAPGVATPYALGYVDFEPEVRVFGRLPPRDAQIGMRVVPTPFPDGMSFERYREDRVL